MSRPLLTRLSLPLLIGLAALSAAPAALAGDVEFNEGKVEGLVVSGHPFTAVSVQNVHAAFDGCGALPNEETCTWSVEIDVHYATPGCVGPTVFWSSGEIAGNGSVDSGPRSSDLGQCPGAGLTLTHSFKKTYGPWEGPGEPPLFYQTGAGSTISLLTESVKEVEERIIRESPAAQLPPTPSPPPRLAVGPGCHRATVGAVRFAFTFKRLGCWKATQIALSAQRGTNPSGYRCARYDDGGFKCIRRGEPRKYVRLDVV